MYHSLNVITACAWEMMGTEILHQIILCAFGFLWIEQFYNKGCRLVQKYYLKKKNETYNMN